MCGGPRESWNLEYDPEKINSFADVMAVTVNATGAQGECVACETCSPGMWRKDCADGNAGDCVVCDQCAEDQYRRNCGIGTNPGECVACEICRAGEFLPDCGGISMDGQPVGSCQQCSKCSADEYMVKDCTSHADRKCAPCLDLPLCDLGLFREGCGMGNEGQCVPCRATLPGFWRVDCGAPQHVLDGGHPVGCDVCEDEFFRDGCHGLHPGECNKCPDCGAGYWRNCGMPSRGDVFYEAGECKLCEDCGAEKFLTGCKFLTPGKCEDCSKCSADEYMVTECDETADRICAPCATLPACPNGQYRKGCGTGSAGDCVKCPEPAVGYYHVTCGGLNPGVCVCACVLCVKNIRILSSDSPAHSKKKNTGALM
jgi:hypothetical protein